MWSPQVGLYGFSAWQPHHIEIWAYSCSLHNFKANKMTAKIHHYNPVHGVTWNSTAGTRTGELEVWFIPFRRSQQGPPGALLFKDLCSCFVCMSALPACVYVRHVQALCPQRDGNQSRLWGAMWVLGKSNQCLSLFANSPPCGVLLCQLVYSVSCLSSSNTAVRR